MAPNPYQVGSRTCGCVDCVADFPPAQYGDRPERDGCIGPWQARFRSEDGRRRMKNFRTPSDAHSFLATLRPKEARHGA
jgi:hypothetical protein